MEYIHRRPPQALQSLPGPPYAPFPKLFPRAPRCSRGLPRALLWPPECATKETVAAAVFGADSRLFEQFRPSHGVFCALGGPFANARV